MPKEGELKFEDAKHKYSVFKEGRWYSPPSFSKIKGQLKQGWAIGYGAKCTAEYLINEVISLIISDDLKLTKADLLSEDYNGLMKTAKRQPQVVSDIATDIGKVTHKALNRYDITGEKPIGLSEKEQNSFNSYLKWEAKNKEFIGKTVFTELPLYCKEHDFCFTMDRVLFFHDELTLMDYKTSKDFYDLDNALQCIAYIKGIEENIEKGRLTEYGLYPGMKFKTGGILRLDKFNGDIAEWKDYSAWLPTAEIIFVLLRDMLTVVEKFNKINGLTY